MSRSRPLKKLSALRSLSPPLWYLAYVAGALLAFLVSAGVGATAAVVVGGSPEWSTSGPAGSEAREATEGTVSATTSEEATSEDASVEKTGDARDDPEEPNPAKKAEETNRAKKAGAPLKEKTAFTHTATDTNSRGDYTYISDPAIDGDPDAVVLVAPSPERENAEGATKGKAYTHNIGVFYEGVNEKEWAVFNQDRAAVSAGTTFEVIAPPASEAFVHHAGLLNTAGERTYLDNPLTNGEPGAVLSITQNWNPGGGRGVYNDHPIGLVYDEGEDEWAIYNKDGARIPDGAAFNVAVSGGPGSSTEAPGGLSGRRATPKDHPERTSENAVKRKFG